MITVPINEAEAIVEPFWDGGSSEHPKDKASLLDAYRVAIDPAAQGKVWQWWCGVVVNVESGVPGRAAVTMERDCDLSLAGYDTFRAFLSLPHWVRMTVRARIDGREVTLQDGVAGPDTMDEFDAPFSGQRLTWLRLEFALTENRTTEILLLWLGLANRAAQAAMEARPSPYTPDWPLCLRGEPEPAEPQIGIFFGAQDLPALRQKCLAGPLAPAFAKLRELAQKDLALSPEAEIGRYIPKPDRRWCRNRDMKRTNLAGLMERLAFVGLIDGNLEMSRMAARMALAAAHSEYWCESPIGVFPGATWHHRSFTEEIYCRACALVLDWAGFCLTQHGQQIVRDAIVMKGLPRIESDFKRAEYIRSMNQGIVFSSGRIIGLLSLLPAYPRYATQLDEAERDLHEMVGAYVHEDGGTLEGVGYWTFTFGTAMPLFYALARRRGAALRDYLPEALVRTGDYALAMLSSIGDGTTYLPINDAHSGRTVLPSLAAAFSQISTRSEWQRLYGAIATASDDAADIYHLIMAPAAPAPREPLNTPRFVSLPAVGHASSLRRDERVGLVHFHLCSGPTYGGHYHQDKGSFILEAAGEALAIDRGITNYDHPETGMLKLPGRHNLLCPEPAHGARFVQPSDARGATLISALETSGVLLLASDNAAAWEPGVFTGNLRRVCSPAADFYLIDDDVTMAQPLVVSFRLNTVLPWARQGNEFRMRGERACLRVVPLNWTPAEATMDVEGIDDHLRPVHVLRLATAPGLAHRLLTAVQVLPVDEEPRDLWQFTAGDGIVARKGEAAARVTPAAEPALAVTIEGVGGRRMAAVCRREGWQVITR